MTPVSRFARFSRRSRFSRRLRGSILALSRRVLAAVFVLSLGAALANAQDDPHPAGTPGADGAEDPADESRFLSGIRQVTFEGRRSGEGYFGADGRRLVFQSEREEGNPFYQIYLLDLETGDSERVSPGRGKTTCAWIHPDGTKVLFASTHEDPDALEKQEEELKARAENRQRRYAWDYDEHFELYERDLESGALRALTSARGYDAEGSWSPDGSRIAFASNRHAYTAELGAADRERLEIDPSYFVDLYIMDAADGRVRRLTTSPGYDGGPFFSPDGKRLCWRRFSEDGAIAEIFTMSIDGTDERQLTTLGAMSWAPFYHPSGEYLILTTNRHGFANFELYLVDVLGEREPVRVTSTPGFDGLPVFKPGGEDLYWTSNRTSGKRSQIFAGRWDHAAAASALAEAGARREVATATSGAAAVLPPASAEIGVEDLERHVRALTDERMAGRLTGTEGERLATQYVAGELARLGLEPAGDDGSYFQAFTFTAGVALGEENTLTVEGLEEELKAQLDSDWRPLAFSATGAFPAAGVVFAGYGIVAPPGDEQEEYDSYVHLDVKDRWVIALRFLPEDVPGERRQHLARHGSLRYKAMVARDRGARGLLLVSGPRSRVKSELVPLAFDAALAGTSIPIVSVSDAVAERLLGSAGRSLAELQEKLDRGEIVMGFQLPGVEIAAEIELEKVQKTGRNVLARLPAADGAEPLASVVVGAHVDHLGRGSSGSLARDDEHEEIHHGADDNASGVASVLEIAAYLRGLGEGERARLRRDVIFAAWSGEELGLLGSKHFIEQLSRKHGDPEHLREVICACLNLDMVGRLEKKLILNGIGSSTYWRREIERRNVVVGLPLSLVEDSYLPTDATSFYLAGVPILSAFTGSHGEYHTPRDTPDLLRYDEMARIARFMALITRSLATSAAAPDYVQMVRPEERGARAGLRAYLGTIPDYGESPIKGLKLSGVASGGPADKAGVRAGDVIVALAGRKVENIYDYTYAIDALKIGEPAEIIVVRGEERLELEITPASRE